MGELAIVDVWLDLVSLGFEENSLVHWLLEWKINRESGAGWIPDDAETQYITVVELIPPQVLHANFARYLA